MTTTRALAVAALLLALEGQAQAKYGDFLEGITGIAQPVPALGYDIAKTSLVFGMRAGRYLRPRRCPSLAVELDLDYTPLRAEGPTSTGRFDDIVHRLRVMAGVRQSFRFRPGWYSTFRVAAGVDFAFASVPIHVVGVVTHEDESDVGLVVEPSVAVMRNLATYAIGAQLALPTAIHRDGDGDFPFDYTGADVALLFTIGSKL